MNTSTDDRCSQLARAWGSRLAAREKFLVGGGERVRIVRAPALHLMREKRQFAACKHVCEAARDPVAGGVAVVNQAVLDRRFDQRPPKPKASEAAE